MRRRSESCGGRGSYWGDSGGEGVKLRFGSDEEAKNRDVEDWVTPKEDGEMPRKERLSWRLEEMGTE